MNFHQLVKDFKLPYSSPGQRHYRQGWINMPCPFCSGNPGNHLGFCLDPSSIFHGRFVCHRCGGKNTFQVISKLLQITEEEKVWGLLFRYHITRSAPLPVTKPKLRMKPLRNVNLPPKTMCLGKVLGAVRYLRKRGFDFEELEALWGVQATGPGSLVNTERGSLDFSYRLIIPIYHQDKLVTYQGRDWTGKSTKKYLFAPPEIESRSAKNLLYGLEKVESDEVVLMEGVTDVWRYGKGAVACFGISYSQQQMLELAKRFTKVIVVFDWEARARLQARKLIKELEEWGVDCTMVKLPKGKDPAEMNREELKGLVR